MSRFLGSLAPARAAVSHAMASNEQFKPATRPVALFLGGTSGIGQAMAEQLAKQTNGRAQIVILGRNQDAADKIIASFPRTPDGTSPEEESKYSFVKVDATSMAQIRSVAAKLSTELGKVNFIVITTGYLTTKGRDESSEGIDRKLACNFYARFRFIHDLAPLIEKAAEKGERTGVMSVFSAGMGGAIDMDDLGLVKGFTLREAASQAVTYTDAAFDEFAARYPKIAFNHIFPGTVTTPMLTNNPGSRFFLPILSPLTVSPEQCAQVMWWRMLDQESKWKTGAHQLNNHGAELGPNQYVTPAVRKAVWDHAVAMTSGSVAGTSAAASLNRIVSESHPEL